ncbi:hypothetical protein [Mycolicibacterium psychrotolerans]|uniref:Secreted protein n=1 Tax=Mycolicibacterium psychrotolerans TaxID=216929 RepID=A0A7I7MD74_9MYCO|nr:hypothetical protein [Mycolicibacterium psychrotolerans]BBX70218.1 hypothetical protein MPSYJ_36790 [Mycolicibacterium psychrotolerans]
MRALVPLVVAAGLLAGAAPAGAAPPEFPDVDAYPAVDPTAYQVFGAHPSMSGWVFSTPAGLRCQDSLIPDLGIFCRGPLPGSSSGISTASVSLTHAGEFGYDDVGSDVGPSPLLPTGSRFAAGNGVVCAVPAADTLACRAAKPDSWPADTPDPPDRRYGEHGFVISPAGSWTY